MINKGKEKVIKCHEGRKRRGGERVVIFQGGKETPMEDNELLHYMYL